MPGSIPYLDEADVTRSLARARVLFTDLDGTLLGRGASLLLDGKGEPTMGAVPAILALNRAGLSAVVTSGRNAKQLRELTRLLDWPDFIGELGCVRSYDRGARRVYETGDWTAGALREGETPYEAIARVGAVELLQRTFPGRIEYHDPWHLDREVTHVLRGGLPVGLAQAALDTLPLPVTIVDNGIIHPKVHGLVGVDEIHAMHLVPTGTSKQRSIEAYLKDRGISGDEALAIGDSWADVGMASAVGLMTIVANGLDDPVLRARAETVGGIVATRGSHGAGWAELATAWLEAR